MPLANYDTVSVLTPVVETVPTAQQATILYNAVRALGELTCTAEQLRAALPQYQHFRVTDNIGRALQLLQEVNDTWTT